MKEEKVILAGTLEALPEPFLDEQERTISCRLKVKPGTICFVADKRFEKDEEPYTVEVRSPIQNIIYETAHIHDRVLVFGNYKSRHYIRDAHLVKSGGF